MLREQNLSDVPFSIAAPTEDDAARARRRRHRGRGRQRRRLHRAEPRARTEPGRDARRLRRPDRARPARRQGAGRRLPRRLGHLALALHARPRPLRRRPRRGAARAAGHAVRLRLALGHGALHQQPAGAGRAQVLRRGRRQLGRRRQRRRQRQVRLQHARSATRPRCAWRRTTRSIGGYIDAVQPDLSVNEDVNTGDRTGVRAAVKFAPTERFTHHPARRLPEGRDGRLEPHRRLQHPGATRSPPRGRAVDPGRARAVHADRRAVHRRVPAGRPEPAATTSAASTLTSITSYTDRDVLVVRDATALTASITGGSIGLPENVYTLDSPLDDATDGERLDAGGPPVRRPATSSSGWRAASTATRDRDYGQSLLVAGLRGS